MAGAVSATPEDRTGAKSGVVGVVLAGGLSSRLGEDKACLRLPRKKYGGTPNAGRPGRPADEDMLTRTIHLLRACTVDVAVSCRASRDVNPWRRIPDEVEGAGPLGALYSILRAESRPVLVLSCDLPFMEEGVLRRLLAAREARPGDAVMTTFRQAETGYIEALVSIYEPACRPWFEAAMHRGLRQLNLVVPESLRVHITYTRQEALPFFNINYPVDLEAARRLAKLP